MNADKKSKKIDYDYVEFYFTKAFPKVKTLVQSFLKFLSNKGKPKLNKDQWTSLYDLLTPIGHAFPKEYQLSSVWSLLFDEFYISYCKEKGIAIQEPVDNNFLNNYN